MSGLDNIVEEIIQQSRAEADGLIADANRKYAEIHEEGRARQEEWRSQFEEAAERERREIHDRAKSADRQNRRRALLEVRNQVLDEVLDGAKAEIGALPDDEYFDFLFRLFKKHAQPRDGVLRLAVEDSVRMPDGFAARCGQVFPECALTLSEDMEGIGRGFVIQYGDMSQDCSLDGIFETQSQVLRDQAYAVLTRDAKGKAE